MTSFVLKIIAVISMFLDHLGDCIYGGFNSFNYIGRLAFPIFAFQISEGYLHTKDLKKYFLRLFAFALISQIPFMLFTSILDSSFHLNIFFTLLLGLLAILIYDKVKNKIIGILSFFLLCIIAELIHVDYGYFGVLIIFIFYIFKDHLIFMNLAYVGAVILKYTPALITTKFYYPNLLLCLATMAPIILLNFYRGKQGKKVKYFLYIFYSVHLLVLYFLHLWITV